MQSDAFLSNELKTFIKIVEAGSFTIAAKALYLSQSALSRRISQLEESLQLRLFDRTPTGIVLTEEGSLLYQRARQLESLARQTMTEIATTPSATKTLRVGFVTKNPYTFAKQACLETHRFYPELDIQPVPSSISRCVQQLVDGELDVFIGHGLPWVRTLYPNVCYTKIFDEPIAVGFGSTHDFANLESVDPSLLSGKRVYTVTPGMIGGDYDRLIEECRLMDTPPMLARSSFDNDFYTRVELEGSLVLGARSHLASNIAWIPLEGDYCMTTYAFHTPQPSGAVRLFISTAISLAAEYTD